MRMASTVLLLGDITGKSRVAVRMMTAALEARGHEVLSLPTALISNTLNLGQAQILDTTGYLLDALRTWEDLGVTYDFLCIGYVTGLAQAQRLAEIADAARARSVPVLVDPILGDNGQKYHSVTDEQAEGMRLLCRHADLITPNLTEARLLAGADLPAQQLAERLGEGVRSVLITSCPGDGAAQGAIIGIDHTTGGRVDVRYEAVPGHHFGTGDLFSALLTDELLRGQSLADAAHEAAQGVLSAILAAPNTSISKKNE